MQLLVIILKPVHFYFIQAIISNQIYLLVIYTSTYIGSNISALVELGGTYLTVVISKNITNIKNECYF